MRSLLLVCSVALAAVSVHAFFPGGANLPSSKTITRQGGVSMKGAGVIGQNVVSTRAGKAARTEQYKEWLKDADLIFAIPSFNLTVKEVYDLRKVMPQGTKVHVAKNTLLRLAVEESGFKAISPKLEGANMWFFVPEDNIKDTFTSLEKYAKEIKKDKSHNYKFGVFEGSLLDTEGVEAVAKLPSKTEVYARLINVLREPPQQLASLLQLGGGNILQVLSIANEQREKGEEAAPAAAE